MKNRKSVSPSLYQVFKKASEPKDILISGINPRSASFAFLDKRRQKQDFIFRREVERLDQEELKKKRLYEWCSSEMRTKVKKVQRRVVRQQWKKTPIRRSVVMTQNMQNSMTNLRLWQHEMRSVYQQVERTKGKIENQNSAVHKIVNILKDEGYVFLRCMLLEEKGKFTTLCSLEQALDQATEVGLVPSSARLLGSFQKQSERFKNRLNELALAKKSADLKFIVADIERERQFIKGKLNMIVDKDQGESEYFVSFGQRFRLQEEKVGSFDFLQNYTLEVEHLLNSIAGLEIKRPSKYEFFSH